jgi:tRNA pseudouridine32 synthase/23S rRNA pseudouridine746 synthase
MKADASGVEAKTTYKVLGRHNTLSLLALSPITGRTHQLRVHCAEMGFPILGDKIYGSTKSKDDPECILHLHSFSITIPLYPKKPSIGVSAPLPEHMIGTLNHCGFTIPL